MLFWVMIWLHLIDDKWLSYLLLLCLALLISIWIIELIKALCLSLGCSLRKSAQQQTVK